MREDNKVKLYSENFPKLGVIEFDLDDVENKDGELWSNYVKGMIVMLKGAGYEIDKGFELLIKGEIPTASGLSSSASLELLVGVVLDDLFKLSVPRLELVQLGQKQKMIILVSTPEFWTNSPLVLVKSKGNLVGLQHFKI